MPQKIETLLGEGIEFTGYSRAPVQHLKWTFHNSTLPVGAELRASETEEGSVLTLFITRVTSSHLGSYKFEYHDQYSNFVLYDKVVLALKQMKRRQGLIMPKFYLPLRIKASKIFVCKLVVEIYDI